MRNNNSRNRPEVKFWLTLLLSLLRLPFDFIWHTASKYSSTQQPQTLCHAWSLWQMRKLTRKHVTEENLKGYYICSLKPCPFLDINGDLMPKAEGSLWNSSSFFLSPSSERFFWEAMYLSIYDIGLSSTELDIPVTKHNTCQSLFSPTFPLPFYQMTKKDQHKCAHVK